MEVIIVKILILIGGATACGKSTLANRLCNDIPNSIKYRRYQGFFDISSKKNIPKNEIFKKISSIEVDDWFVNVCSNSEVVISDVHYAVQMNRNEMNTNADVNIYQNYVSTISDDLLKKLSLENIRVIAIFLSCSPLQCFTRAISRYSETKKNIRNISLEDATMENLAEEKVWNNILATGLVEGFKLDSEHFSVEQLTDQCLKYLNSCKAKKLLRIKIDE